MDREAEPWSGEHDVDGVHHCESCGSPLTATVLHEQAVDILSPWLVGRKLVGPVKRAVHRRALTMASPFYGGDDICFQCAWSRRDRTFQTQMSVLVREFGRLGEAITVAARQDVDRIRRGARRVLEQLGLR